ncbi:MAG: tRNA threonylcarbamoyladenosine dehydratase [Burkholderiaceae bacterium]
MSEPALTGPSAGAHLDADSERRFGGLRRLYGAGGYERLRAARVAVIGLGGVGSWAAEALARSGVAQLVLVDLDHVSESNVNRQVQALGETIGMSKAGALARRIADIHPGCVVHCIEEFADESNWPGLLPVAADAVIDACDQGRAKLALAAWALRTKVAYVCCGAAGGKRRAEKIDIDDLSAVTHDPLLAGLRQRLRSRHAAPRVGRIGVRCVFSRESVAPPAAGPEAGAAAGGSGPGAVSADVRGDGTLNCHGYGSTVTVTASFGMAAAGEVISALLA